MHDFNYFVFARALHIVSLVFWIGGVAFVTTVLIPSIKKMSNTNNRLETFEQLENAFSFQAKISTLAAGLSGFYMLSFMDAWDRYLQLEFWWLHLMTCIWLIFSAILFVFEPLFLHQWFHHKATKDHQAAFDQLHTMHKLLLGLSLVAIVGAMAGSHGFKFF